MTPIDMDRGLKGIFFKIGNKQEYESMILKQFEHLEGT